MIHPGVTAQERISLYTQKHGNYTQGRNRSTSLGVLQNTSVIPGNTVNMDDKSTSQCKDTQTENERMKRYSLQWKPKEF